MQSLAAILLQQAQALSLLEVVAVTMALLYLVFAIRQNIWCWVFAGISTAIYVYLFIAARLYMESVLNVFYFAMAIYGWSVWYSGRSDNHELPVSKWALPVHSYAIAAIIAASLVSGYLLDTRTDAAFQHRPALGGRHRVFPALSSIG